jgi:hypothetical protein
MYDSSKIYGLKDQAAVNDSVENVLHTRSDTANEAPSQLPFRYPQEEALRALRDFEFEVMARPRHSE